MTTTADLLEATTFEIIPLRHALEAAASLPSGSDVSVTASPSKPIEATIELAIALHQRGHVVVPHLAARMIRDRAHLAQILETLTHAGVGRVFVVGGDAADPGEYPDAARLLAAMRTVQHGIGEVGIAGYPEGHPSIPNDVLMEALVEKAPQAHWITTQMCFDVEAIVRWIGRIRGEGVTLPVRVGIPGVVDPVRLAAISARIGVGPSMRYLAKHRSLLWRLLRPGAYRLDRLVRDVARAAASGDLGIAGLHIFTFNRVGPTVDWWRSATEQASG